MTWDKAQIDEFMTQEPRVGRLATASGSGEPNVVPIWFRVESDRILVHSMGESTKVRNVRENGRFSLTVDKDTPPYAGVTLTGSAEILGADDFDYAALIDELAVRYLGPAMGAQMGPMIASVPGEHVTLALRPEQSKSWDYSQM